MEKLLIMGCSIGTQEALQYAKEQGVYTIITDYNSEGKQKLKKRADESWDIDVADIDRLEEKCKEEGITGVFAATSEYCLDQTRKLCKRLHLPFYASDEGWLSSRDKERFKKHCASCGLKTAKRYEIFDPNLPTLPSDISWPVIVKPVDAHAQIGLSVCYNEQELRKGLELGLYYSTIGKVLVEEYIEGVEIGAVYIFKDEQIYPVNISDFICIPINGRNNFTYIKYNSTFSDEYNRLFPRIEALFKNMDCHSGVASLQAIRRDGVYYFLEMGYRLNGGGTWFIDEKLVGLNIVKHLVDFALGHESSQNPKEKYLFSSKYHAGGTYFLWARPGIVMDIKGVQTIEKMEGVQLLSQNFHIGDHVPEEMNMKQIAFSICLVAEDESEAKKKLLIINKSLHMYDMNGQEMLIYFYPHESI